MLRILHRRRLGQPNHGVLGRVVGRRSGQHGQAQRRCGVDDHAATLAQHLRDGELHPQPYRLEVDSDDLVELLLGNLSRQGIAAADAGIVEHHVQTSPTLDTGSDQVLHLRRLSHVDRAEGHHGALRFQFGQYPLALERIDIGQHDPRALSGEGTGNRLANARCGSGDQYHLVLELHALLLVTQLRVANE
ncbi:hypothetical protein D3C85_1355330 [compost metagenome]